MYLREHDANEVVNAATDFARRQPALVVGGALLVGLALGRFLRSASDFSTDDQRFGHGLTSGYRGRTFNPPASGYTGIGSAGTATAYAADVGYDPSSTSALSASRETGTTRTTERSTRKSQASETGAGSAGSGGRR
jgi:hypothetical protein